MKKVLFFAVLAVCGLMFVSCAKQTPTATCEKALKCIQEKDWEGYMELVQFKDREDAEKAEKIKNGFREMLEKKMSEQLEKKEGIKDFKVVEETIEEEKATVKYQITWGNGDQTEDDMKMINVDGKWKLDAGK